MTTPSPLICWQVVALILGMGAAHQLSEGLQAHSACDSKDHGLVGQNTRQVGQALLQTETNLKVMGPVEQERACKEVAEAEANSRTDGCKATLSGGARRKCMSDAWYCKWALMYNCEQHQPKDIGDIPICKVPQQIVVKQGVEVTPTAGQSYQFRAVSDACKLGSDGCDQAIVDKNKYLTLGNPPCREWVRLCVNKELELEGYSLIPVGVGQFYIGRVHQGKNPLVISFTDEDCPMASASEAEKCRMLNLLESGQGVPWQFEKVEGTSDRFTITSALGCPNGQWCGWKLSVHEIPCPMTGIPMPTGLITLETNPTISIQWRLLPTPVKATSLSHLAGFPSHSLEAYLNAGECRDGHSRCSKWGKRYCREPWYTSGAYKCLRTCELC